MILISTEEKKKYTRFVDLFNNNIDNAVPFISSGEHIDGRRVLLICALVYNAETKSVVVSPLAEMFPNDSYGLDNYKDPNINIHPSMIPPHWDVKLD